MLQMFNIMAVGIATGMVIGDIGNKGWTKYHHKKWAIFLVVFLPIHFWIQANAAKDKFSAHCSERGPDVTVIRNDDPRDPDENLVVTLYHVTRGDNGNNSKAEIWSNNEEMCRIGMYNECYCSPRCFLGAINP